jgi:catalase
LGKEAAAIDFVRDAFGHLKAIGIDQCAERLLKMVGVEKYDGVIAISAMERIIALAKSRQWDREASVRILA